MSFTRRNFIQSSAALAGASGLEFGLGLGGAEAAPVPTPFRFAYSATSWDQNIEEAIKVGQRLKLPGIEPFRNNVVNYLDRPLVLKKMMADAGLQMASCSNGGAPGDGKVRRFSGNFYDASKISDTIEDHIKFA